MKAFSSSAAVKLALPALLGVVGTLVAMLYPSGHSAFCAGVAGVM